MRGPENKVDIEDIDLEKVIWDPRYRREVIERLNREVAEPPAADDGPREQTG